MSPEFLDVGFVLELHSDQLALFGGSGGIRDLNLLEAAVAQAAATFGGEYLHEDLFAMAAAYLFHISKNHPFVDGNKRTALAAALTFLDLNGFTIDETESQPFDLADGVASSRITKAEAAEILRSLATPI